MITDLQHGATSEVQSSKKMTQWSVTQDKDRQKI